MSDAWKEVFDRLNRMHIHRILDAVLDINGMQESKAGHPTAFMRISGHTAHIDVDVYRNGWKSGGICENIECYFDDHKFGDTPTQMVEKLEKLKEELENNNAI